VPEYSVDQFNYVSTHESVRDWNLISSTAYFYNSAGIVHARTVKAYLFDPDGKITIVTGQEAKYIMVQPSGTATKTPSPAATGKTATANDRDLEVFGNVVTTFPDGFEVHSEYMRYRPDLRTVEIPSKYLATGRGKDSNGQVLSFKSQGMFYSRKSEQITLPRDVEVTVEKQESAKTAASKSGPDKTIIHSDRCVISREQKLAIFTMFPERPIQDRYVRVTQPTMFSKGRRGELNYGDNSEAGSKMVHKVALFDDVLVKETSKDGPLRYATAGQANFEGTQDIVVLTKFPQVYENQDTVTGDKIILHRDSDVVEVEHSNSYSAGEQIK
jgi:hypothetical protein